MVLSILALYCVPKVEVVTAWKHALTLSEPALQRAGYIWPYYKNFPWWIKKSHGQNLVYIPLNSMKPRFFFSTQYSHSHQLWNKGNILVRLESSHFESKFTSSPKNSWVLGAFQGKNRLKSFSLGSCQYIWTKELHIHGPYVWSKGCQKK